MLIYTHINRQLLGFYWTTLMCFSMILKSSSHSYFTTACRLVVEVLSFTIIIAASRKMYCYVSFFPRLSGAIIGLAVNKTLGGAPRYWVLTSELSLPVENMDRILLYCTVVFMRLSECTLSDILRWSRSRSGDHTLGGTCYYEAFKFPC